MRKPIRSARNRAASRFTQSRAALIIAVGEEFDARGGGTDDEKTALREQGEVVSALMMHATKVIESVGGLEKQRLLFLVVDELTWAIEKFGELMKNNPFIEDAQKRRRAADKDKENRQLSARALAGLAERKKQQLELLSPIIRASLKKHPEWKPGAHAKAQLDEANRLLDQRGLRKIGQRTLSKWVAELNRSSGGSSLQN